MAPLPPRFCEICSIIHAPPINDLSRCHPLRSGRVYFTKINPEYWPSEDEMTAMKAYWEAVLADKGTKPLS